MRQADESVSLSWISVSLSWIKDEIAAGFEKGEFSAMIEKR